MALKTKGEMEGQRKMKLQSPRGKTYEVELSDTITK